MYGGCVAAVRYLFAAVSDAFVTVRYSIAAVKCVLAAV